MEQTSFTVAEIQLSYAPNYKIADRPEIRTSKQTYQILLSKWPPSKIEFIEEFKIILLNTKNRVLGIVDISVGGINATYVDPKIIFVAALKAKATGIILCHNHSSGEFKPSEADRNLTRRVSQGGELLDIKILDHLIIGKEDTTVSETTD